MNKSTFLTCEKPLITCMVQASEPSRIKELIKASLPEGAEAFGMQFCQMKKEYRNKETYKQLFELSSPRPIYVTNYRHSQNLGKSDDVLADELVELAECGATLCDVMGDCFDACEGELTMNEEAVKQQIELIDRLHKSGAEVLMSSHVLKFIPAERVLEIAMEHQKRGADICKIVTGAENAAQEIENLRIINLLKENLEIPFLFLSGGESRFVRRIGASFGSCMYLCVHEYDEFSTNLQPLVKDVKLLRDSLGM